LKRLGLREFNPVRERWFVGAASRRREVELG
jgi:hypothetical protein